MSLCSHYKTQIVIFEAVPNPSNPNKTTLKQREPPGKAPRDPTTAEINFINEFYKQADKSFVPTTEQFNQLVERSANIKQKFRLLKDTSDQTFIDTVVEIVRDPVEDGDRMTVWVTDYTENDRFIMNSVAGYGVNDSAKDEYGYSTKFAPGRSQTSASLSDTIGGQRLFQVTLWEPQSIVIKDCNLKKGSWVQFRNLQVAFDRNYTYLEGYMRQDQRYPQKINVSPLDPLENDRENAQLKDAIRRKQEYLKVTKKKQSAINEAAEAGKKRKANIEASSTSEASSTKLNAKQTRSQKRKVTHAGKAAEYATKADEPAEVAKKPEVSKPAQDIAINPQGMSN